MPNLRLHQLRVASVSRAIAMARGIDAHIVTIAGLLHDMGNILKSDFSVFPPEYYGDSGLMYWEGVKRDYLQYGSDEHEATETIARALGASVRVIELINGMGFAHASEILTGGDLELQICEYADQRVAPYGITTLQERLREGKERYAKRMHSAYGNTDEEYERHARALSEIESTLFSGIDLRPEDLSDETLAPMLEELRGYDI